MSTQPSDTPSRLPDNPDRELIDELGILLSHAKGISGLFVGAQGLQGLVPDKTIPEAAYALLAILSKADDLLEAWWNAKKVSP